MIRVVDGRISHPAHDRYAREENRYDAGRTKPDGFTNEEEAPRTGTLGRQISGQRCSALDSLLYAYAWFRARPRKPAGFWTGLIRRSQTDPQWPRGVGLSPDARWPPAGTRRMEPGGPAGRSEEHTSELQS